MQRGPGHSLVSRRKYGTAVALAAVFGTFGIHHFYLGRHGLGVLDLGVTLLGITLLFTDYWVVGILMLVADFVHGFVETIRLAVGAYRDGDGAVVAYPGQVVTRREPS